MTYRPKIGLTMRLEIETRRFYLGRDYSEAVEASGGVPVHLSLIPKAAYIAEALSQLDGILLPGSDTDIDPSYYDQDPHPRLGKVIPEKDETDILVLAEAEKLGLPVLAICYGMQSLNVSRGGNLIQDIESHVANCIRHEQGKPADRSSHGITIAQHGILASLAVKGSNDKAKVNSSHHQAIGTLGENLVATAWANDGVIECIEDNRQGRFVFGVQWHPELSWQTDVLSKAIFDHFVENCFRRRNADEKTFAGA
jgi:putative glutamine amidotransferase